MKNLIDHIVQLRSIHNRRSAAAVPLLCIDATLPDFFFCVLISVDTSVKRLLMGRAIYFSAVWISVLISLAV